MFDRLAGLILRKPRAVLLVTLLLVLAAGAASSGLNSRVTLGGYEKEGSESQRTTQVLQDKFDQGDPNLVLLVTDERGVDSPAAQAAGLALTQRLAGEADISNVVSYWSAGRAEQLRSQDSSKALVTATIEGDFDAVLDRIKTLAPAYSGDFQGARVQVGGSAMTWDENIKTSAEDISRAEAIVFPLVLVVLVLIFGSLLAALVPLAVAFVTMLLAMLLMFLLTLFTEPSSFVTNITVFLGLGLAIDYSLLMVSRYREELRRGRAMPDAIRAMLRTSGRTVVFSAVTVAVALGALLVFPFTIFDSMAYASIATALLAAVASLVVVPALLAWMGPRIDKWRLFHRKDRSEQRLESGFWHRLAMFVMRRPVPVAVVVIAVLLLLGAPALGLKLRLPDEQILPKDAQAAQVLSAVRTEFASREQDAVQVVAEGVGDAPAGEASRRFATQDATFLTVIPTVDGYSQEGEDLVRAVRDTERPFPVTVGGTPAVSVDTFDAIYDTLPVFLVVLAVGMFILLFLLTGSLLLPVMAMALSLLSLTATFGALVFIFQDGNLQSVVGDFNVTGAITWTVPILVFALGFGLSMDYQVFLLSRIREEYERSGDNTASVAVGIERVGRVVTYAAALISIVFLVWVTSGISYMKAIGVGMPIAILMDATLIRGALLPALMRLAGDANWSAPGPLRRLHARLGLREHAEPAPNEAAVPERTSAEVR